MGGAETDEGAYVLRISSFAFSPAKPYSLVSSNLLDYELSPFVV